MLRNEKLENPYSSNIEDKKCKQCFKGILYDFSVLFLLQFSGESAEMMKASYGVFCSGHLESVQIYKDLMEKKKFQMFIRVH